MVDWLDKPQYPIETRRRAIALQDAALLASLDNVNVADWLEHFHGYPYDDPGLSEAEKEAFIEDTETDDNERYVVKLDDCESETYGFRTIDSAYKFFCETYGCTLMRLGIKKGD